MTAAARLAAARLASALLAACVCACESRADIGSDCGEICADDLDGRNGDDVTLPAGRLPSGEIDRLDLLLVVDDSGGMLEEQQAFANTLPHLFEVLSTGDLDDDREDTPEFHPVADIQVGVVSTNLGLGGVPDVSNCLGLGDDAELTSCDPSVPFARFSPDGDPGALAMNVACGVQLGDLGCAFEQPLEAALRALGSAPDGHGAGINQGFLRDDSLLVVLQLSDEDDCSLLDPRIATPPAALPPGDPLASQGLDVRCIRNPDGLYPISRYIDGLKALRPGAEDRAMFFAIAGVPAEMVGADALRPGTLEDADARGRFYDAILNAPAMLGAVDERSASSPDDDAVVAVCDGENGPARPARRLVEVARGFGMNGLVQSICERDLSRAIDVILRSIARRLGTAEI
jgi:hypothetical protein